MTTGKVDGKWDKISAHRKPINGQLAGNLLLDPDEMSILKVVKCAQESGMSFQVVVRGVEKTPPRKTDKAGIYITTLIKTT
jgi:hypothetical protein